MRRQYFVTSCFLGKRSVARLLWTHKFLHFFLFYASTKSIFPTSGITPDMTRSKLSSYFLLLCPLAILREILCTRTTNLHSPVELKYHSRRLHEPRGQVRLAFTALFPLDPGQVGAVVGACARLLEGVSGRAQDLEHMLAHL